MNVVIITQNDVFYLPKSLEFLIQNFPQHSKISGAVILDISPFGKRESFLQRSLKTLRIFGPRFFFRYSFKFVWSTLRGIDVVSVFSKFNIPILNLKGNINDQESLAKIQRYNPDLLISIAANQIFKKPLLELTPRGVLNLHTALLPKYRGLMPTFWVLKNNEQYTGVSVFFVDQGVDSGPILVQKRIPIGTMSQEELIIVTKKLGMEAIIEAVNLIQNSHYKLLDNNDNEMTYYSFPTQDDVKEFKKLGKRFY